MVVFILACFRLKTGGYLWTTILLAGLVVALANRHAFVRLAGLAHARQSDLVDFAPGLCLADFQPDLDGAG